MLKDIQFKIPISIGLSICVLTFVGFILGLFGLLHAVYVRSFMALIVLVPLVYFRKEFFKNIKRFDVKKLFDRKNLLIFLLLISVFSAVYFVRLGAPQLYFESTADASESVFLPVHADEWTHLAQIRYAMSSGENSFVNPYFKELPPHNNFESGFHTFTASFFLLTGLDAVKYYHVLAAAFAAFAALLIYSFLSVLTKQRIAGILGMLFFLSLPSNTSLLGAWFFVPMSMSIFLIFLFLTLLYQAKRPVHFYLLGFVLVTSLFIYPFVAILLGIVSLFYAIRKRDALRRILGPLHGGVIIGLMLLGLLLVVLLTDLKTILSLIIFEKGWEYIETLYSPISFVGIPWLLLSLFGMWVMFIKKYEKDILYVLAVLSINILAFYLFEKSILFVYRINFYYFLLLMGIFGAIGSAYIWDRAGNIFKKRYITIAAQGIGAVLLLVILFSGYYQIGNERHKLRRFVDAEEFYALEAIGQRYTGEIIMADILISQAIYPVTGNYVVGMLSSNLGGGNVNAITNFFSDETSCERKQRILERNGVTLVLSKEEIVCDYLVQDGEYGNLYLYKTS